MKRVKSLLQERTEQAGDTINKIKKFTRSLDDQISWYSSMLPKLDRIKKTLNFINKKQIDELSQQVKTLAIELSDHGSQKDMLTREAETLQPSLNADSSSAIYAKLKQIQENASRAELLCRDLESTLDKATRAASKYFECRAELEPWLDEVERRFEADFTFDQGDTEAALEELSLLSEDIAERRLLVDRIVTSGEKLSTCGGGSQVRDEADHINQRYQDTREQCRAKKRELQQLSIEHQQYSDRLKTLNSSLGRIMDRVSGLERPEANIDRCRASRRDCDNIKKELERLLPTKNSVMKSSTQFGKAVKPQLDEIETSWKQINQKVNQRQEMLIKAEQMAEKFWARQTQVNSQMDQLDDDLRALKESHESQKQLIDFQRKQDKFATHMEQLKQEALKLSDIGDNQDALRVCNEISNHFDRMGRIYAQKRITIEGAQREHEQSKKKNADSAAWLKSVKTRLGAMTDVGTPDECSEKLRIINDIRNQSVRYSAHIPSNDWRLFDKELSTEMQNTEMKLIELGHFESALDEISDWTSRCGKNLTNIGQEGNLQTDLARIELIEAELKSRRDALNKLDSKARLFPQKQRRLEAIKENLEKIESIASTKSNIIHNRLAQMETSALTKKKVQQWTQEVAEMLVSDGPYSSNPDETRKQYTDLHNIISEMTKKRAECPEALSDTRWMQMDQALQERKTKLNSLLVESEKFWEGVTDAQESLNKIDEDISAQNPPSVLEDVVQDQIDLNRALEDTLTMRKDKLRLIDESASVLRASINREDSLKVRSIYRFFLRSDHMLLTEQQ